MAPRRSVHTVGIMLAIGFLVVSRSNAQLTATQVLDRSKKTYDTLKSYKGTSTVVANSTMGGMKQTFNTSAAVLFTRPGKIRVDGNLMMAGKYAIVSDGT